MQNYKKTIEKVLEKALESLGISGASLEVNLISDDMMRQLNLETRGKDNPTNVLSFEYPDMPKPDVPGYKYLGEIYLAPDFIEENDQIIERLAVHGLLHLLGYDHIEPEDEKVMDPIEDKLFEELNI